MKKMVVAFFMSLLLAASAPIAHADSGPPWAQNLDNLAYTEQEGWKKLDADVSVTSDTNDFSEGYVEVSISSATSADGLRLVNGGSLTVSDGTVYWDGVRVGAIDSEKDGSDGVLRINFTTVVPLTNADFESGDLTGWTVNDSYPGVAGQDWVESPADDPDVTNVDSDPLYDDHSIVTQTAEVQTLVKYEGTNALKLTIGGNVAEGYGTAHGPMVTSTTFDAAEGDQLSVTWNAVQGGDWYDVYGFVIKDADNDGIWDDGESYQKLFHDVGSDTGGWITTNADINSTVAGDNLRFVFLNGNYDRSGMQGIGSSLYIDGIDLQISGTPTVNDSIMASIIECIEYRNTSDNPPATKTYTLSFEESDDGTGFNTAQINITPVNDPPTGITLSNNHISENQPSGTVVGTLSSTGDPDSSSFTYSIIGGDTVAFSINGTELRTAAIFDYETKNSYSVEIQTDDGASEGTYNDTFSISVDDIGDTTDPNLAVVTAPANGSCYNAASMPTTFSGTAADAASSEVGGLSADSTTFTLKRSDNKYWDGDSWESSVTWLSTTHGATSNDTTANWTDNIDLPAWDEDTYTVQAKATDKVGNSFSGTAITFTYDNTPPIINSVTSDKSDGAYTSDEIIDIVVTFSEAVNVTGSPYLELETGTTDRNAAYQGGTGTASITFRYTVQTGDASADLDYKATDSLNLNSGTIKDAASNNATLTLASPGESGSLGANKALVIDTDSPITATATTPVDGSSYKADTMTVPFTGSAADNDGGSGLDASSTTFTLKRSDDKYWDGNSWETSATWLTTTHSATTGNTTTAWTDGIDLPVWANDTYTVQVKATDRAGNTFTGTAVTFVYDAASPVITITDIDDYVSAITQISGTVSDASPGQVAGVQASINDTTADKYWDGDSWEDSQTWLDATISTNWSYNTSLVNFSDSHAYTVTARAADEAGNASTDVTDSFTFDSASPIIASVTIPVDGASYRASSIPASFSGNVSDDAAGAGLSANSATFYIKDTTDSKYWDGTSWEDSATWLTATNYATTDGSEVAWSDTIGIYWTDGHTYEVKAKATDRASNTFTGTAVTFTYDITPPTISNVTSAKTDGAYTTAEVIDITVIFTEAVNITGSPYLELETGTTDQNATYQDGTGTANITFRYTVQAGDAASDINCKAVDSLKLNGGTIRDIAGNDATLTLASPGEAGSLGANKTLAIDTGSPIVAIVTAPLDGGSYNAASIPALFSGSASDNTSGAGMNADSVTFYIKDTSDNTSWDGDSWESTVTWLSTTHGSTTGNTTAAWSDNVSLLEWSDGHSYEVKARATDKAGNTFEGTTVTFLYDTTSPEITINDIADSVTSLTQISGTASDTAPGQVAGVQVSISDNSTSRYWDGGSWESSQAWLDAAASANWTYNTSSVTFSNNHLYRVTARSADEAGNTSDEASDSFTYSVPSTSSGGGAGGGGGGGGGGVTDETDETILAASTDATATDSNGNNLDITGADITVTDDGEALTVNIPVKLRKGEILSSFTDPNGVTYKDNTLIIPSVSTEKGDYYFRITSEESELPSFLSIKTADAVGTGRDAEARILSINANAEFTARDFTSGNPSLGEVASALELDLNTLPREAEVKITTSLEPDEASNAAFKLAATAVGMGNTESAYTINIVKTNLENGTDIKSATITMKVGTRWVEEHGGVDAVRIVRYDAETGEREILETSFLGQDEQGRAVFKGLSPRGLSVFGLLGEVVKPTEPVINQTAATPEPVEEVAEKSSPSKSKTLIPASFTVSNFEVSPMQAISGQPVTISCDVTNTGEVEGNYNAVLRINGVVETSQLVVVAGGQRTTLTFSVTKDTGNYDIEIGGERTTLEVAPSPSQPVSSGLGLWWILIGLSIIAIALYIWQRRRGELPKIFRKGRL